MENDFGHWIVKSIPNDLEKFWGFVYIITNKAYITPKYYIGCKQLKFKKTRQPLKGKKNKRRSLIDSDWKTYTGSSTELNEDILKYGKELFTFEILRFCENKSTMKYYEAKEQFDRDALLRPDYYNGIVNLRCGRRGLPQMVIENNTSLIER